MKTRTEVQLANLFTHHLSYCWSLKSFHSSALLVLERANLSQCSTISRTYNCLSSRSDICFGVPRGQFLVLCFLLSMPLHLVAWSPDMLSLIISMLMIASCMFPFHQATLLQRWMVYSHVWLLSSHGCRQINWNWTQIKRNSSSLGMNGNGANIFLCFQ